MTFEIDIGFASQAGRKDINEDFVAAMLPEAGREHMGVIAAIADGVSQGGMGREAAQTTVTSLVRDYYGTPDTWDTTVALDRIISAQNAWLTGVNRRRRPALGMTTLTALVLRGHSYTLAHAGDTRAYLLRGTQLVQLTSDHVVDHPDFSHQLLRAVGMEDHLVMDYQQGDVQVGDVLLLLTDGVHGKLSDKRLRELLIPAVRLAPPGLSAVEGVDGLMGQAEHEAPPSAQSLSEQLIALALAAGSTDNASALVLRVQGLSAITLTDVQRQAQALPIPARFKVGDVIDGMAITALVADNGINLLYQARHPQSRKLYALKTLHPARAHDPEERAMLAHEAWLAQHLHSSAAAEHLVALHAPGVAPSSYYLLYDWHAGHTVQQQLAQKDASGPRYSVAQALAVANAATRVLGQLHRQGIIHRDVKPANLHQGDDGVLRLLDLGVALSGRESAATRTLHAGTPSYINPEQWGYGLRGGSTVTDAAPEPPDAQSDLYALGVTLYQMLCLGKLPYGEVLPYQSGRYFRDAVAPSRHNPEVPIWLDHIVLKAIARDKRERFETAEELLLALERGASRPLSAPRATPLMQRDPSALWKLLLGFSVLLNLVLLVWVVFLPK